MIYILCIHVGTLCSVCTENLLCCDQEKLHKMIEHIMPSIEDHLDYTALWPYLVKHSVLSNSDMQKLQLDAGSASIVTRNQRAVILYEALCHNNSFQKFVKALCEQTASGNGSLGHRQVLEDLLSTNMFTVVSHCSPALWTTEDLNCLDPHFKVFDTCGEGTFSVVYSALYYGTDSAAKVIKENNPAVCENSWHEAKILSSCSHPRIVQCYEVKSSAQHRSAVLILEMMKCDLVSFIEHHKDTVAAASQQILFACDISSALSYLHKKKITHGNITSHNVLVAVKDLDQYLAKLCDFGLAKTPLCSPHPLHNQSHTMFMAPEHHTPTSSPSEKADIFSAGVVFLNIVTQMYPYYDAISPNQCRTGKRIAELILRQSHLLMINRDAPHLEVIIKRCLQDEPEHRPSAPELCTWFNNFSSYQHIQQHHRVTQYVYDVKWSFISTLSHVPHNHTTCGACLSYLSICLSGCVICLSTTYTHTKSVTLSAVLCCVMWHQMRKSKL